jgi:UDP-N-acetylglucosamine 2-epimerase (non-hydrolysing)
MNKSILHIVGARPNFMKLAPVYKSLDDLKVFDQKIIHTGQHYDHNMSDIFFNEFQLPAPNFNLNINGGSNLEQLAKGILAIEKIILGYKPDLMLVYGDINATLFSAIVASKLGVKIGHIEAGLRSFDKSMPEETNRILTDVLSDYYFTPSEDANDNLLKEGVDLSKIYFVGNVMIDTLIKFSPIALEAKIDFELPEEYCLVTLHRPSNVDNIDDLKNILDFFQELGKTYKVIFPLHPRTRKIIKKEYLNELSNIIIIEPLGYLQFIKLQKNAKFVITDSGGIQEETTYLGVPCFTLRENTERPITINVGTNTLVGSNLISLARHIEDFKLGIVKKGQIPDLWDGKTSNRISEIIFKILS